jgi:catechol 2,3-dioxygenase-like lactoylglutathione lyase family enzyme
MSDARVHVHLVVSDFARSEKFYAELLGAEPVKQMPGYSKFLPTWAPINLAISEGDPSGATVPQHHLGIQVDSPQEVLEHLARAKAAGLQVDEEIGVTCCYANQDKFWVTDPDGLRWEIYHLNFDVETPGKSLAGRTLTLLPMQACCSPD